MKSKFNGSNDEDTHIIVFCSIENLKFLCSKILIKIQNLTVIVSFDKIKSQKLLKLK